ncbi:MAG: N-acetyl-gamma-glutamyl-phosphate reductase [Thermodesulfobacteriota bacterium]
MIRAVVVGATGYTGAELIRLLVRHPDVEVTMVTSRQYIGQPVADIYPSFAGDVDAVCREFSADEVAENADVVFTALPHELPMTIAPGLLDRGCRVIDLSADFRFSDPGVYETVYRQHTAPDYCRQSVYGLCEIYQEKIREARLVGNPGCYPTSILLPLIPLIRREVLGGTAIIADSKSGVSGAGRSPSLGVHICEVSESFKAYKVNGHRHAPEIRSVLSAEAGGPVGLTFVPHLVPMIRGMLSTVYADLAGDLTAGDVRDILGDCYRGRKFVRICPEGRFPETRFVRGSNYCDIGVAVDAPTRRLILVSAIDNLVKGASGQAVQNMNIMFGLPEDRGLDMIPFPV